MMGIMGDRKKAVTAILGPDSGNVGKRAADGSLNESGAPDPLHVISGEMIDAAKAGDHKAFADGLRAAHAHMTGTEGDMESEESEATD